MLQRKPNPHNAVLDPRAVEGLTEAARVVVETHHALAKFLHVGVTLPKIDHFIADTLKSLGASSCFHRYKVPGSPPFPSFACLSVNECVVHGTAGYYDQPMKAGDVLKVDIGSKKQGWIGDAAWTYVFGEPTEEVARLTACGKECLRLGLEQLMPGKPLLEWAKVTCAHVEDECGFKMIRGLGGHGYGRKLHMPPYISNVPPTYANEWPDANTKLMPGMAIAVEPMIAVGSPKVTTHPSGWPLMVEDGSQSVHYEHDVLITEGGQQVLTAALAETPDVIGV